MPAIRLLAMKNITDEIIKRNKSIRPLKRLCLASTRLDIMLKGQRMLFDGTNRQKRVQSDNDKLTAAFP